MANFGETLKRERELRDIPLRDIANATKINLRYLEALEANRFDKLPGGVFNKGFIRAYARFIGADGEALVQRYIDEQAEREAAVASAMPTPERPGLHRPAQAPPRRTDPALPAGEAPSSPPITFAEGRAASAAVAAMASARRGGAPAAATMSFQTGTAGPQARLLLAGTTVVAAFAALAVVVYLVRTVRHDARLPGASHDSAPAAAPGAADPAGEAPPDAAPQGEADADPEGAGAAAPDGTPDGGTDKEIAPATPPSPKPLPEVPRERDRTTTPVRVASPIPVPAQEPVKTPPRPSTAAAPPPAPSPADASPPSAPGPMTLLVQGVNPVMVQLGCDGVDRPARMLVAGEVVALRCYSLVRISTEDAGAVRLTLDGAACPPLGSSGSRVEHYTIRAEDARAICPPGGAGGHGRR